MPLVEHNASLNNRISELSEQVEFLTAQLQDQNHQLKIVSSISNEIQYRYSVHGDVRTILWANDKFCEEIGLGEGVQFSNNIFYNIVNEEDKELYEHHCHQAFSGVQTTQEFRIVVDNHTLWLRETQKAHINLFTHTIDSIFCSAEDITTHKLLENEFIDCVQRLCGITQNSIDLIFQTDISGRIIYTTDSVFQILGYEPYEFIGNHYSRYFTTDELLQFNAAIERVIQNDEINLLEIKFLRSNKEQKFTEVKITTLKETGKVIGIQCIVKDINYQKHLEKQIQQNDDFFRIVVDYNYDWEYWMRPDGTFQYVSPSCERITGYTAEDFYQNPELAEEIIFENDITHLENHKIQENNSDKLIEYELRIVTKDGQIRWLDHKCQPIYTKDGQYLGRRASNRDITEQQSAIEALRKSEYRYRSLVESADDMIVVLDTKMRVILRNSTYYTIAGNDPKSDNTFDDLSRIYPPDVEGIHLKLRELVANGKASGEYRMIHTNGELVYVSAKSVALYDSDGKCEGYLTISRDITKQKKENFLIKKLSTAVEQSANSVVITDNKGNVEYINQKFLQITGYSQAELLGHNPRILKSGKHPSMYYKDLWDTILRGETWRGEIINRKKDGTFYFEATTITPIKNELNEIVNFIGIKEDNTEFRIAQQKLLGSENKYRKLVQMLGEGIGLVDVHENFVFVNPAAEEIFGVESGTLTGRNLIEFLDNEEFEKIKSETALRKTGIQNTYDLKINRLNGESRYLIVTATPNYDENDNFVSTFGVFRDNTDRRNAELALKHSEIQLRELNATKDKFFSIIAHDLKNPFNTLIGFSDLLVKNFDRYDDTRKKKTLQIILESSRNTFKLLENLLDWSRSQTGRINFKPEIIKIRNLAHETCLLLSINAQQKNISLNYDISENDEVFADKEMLKTVFRNLISNAIKFSHQFTTIVIRSVNFEKHIDIQFIDQGVGIDADKIGKLFKIGEKFTSTKGTGDETGTGLGLILCKEFVERNKGMIFITSELDKGTTFTVTLPRFSEENK